MKNIWVASQEGQGSAICVLVIEFSVQRKLIKGLSSSAGYLRRGVTGLGDPVNPQIGKLQGAMVENHPKLQTQIRIRTNEMNQEESPLFKTGGEGLGLSVARSTRDQLCGPWPCEWRWTLERGRTRLVFFSAQTRQQQIVLCTAGGDRGRREPITVPGKALKGKEC